MYENGEGVPQDYAQAVTWYRRAAEQGVSEAQTNLGVMYENGEGVPQDYAQAVTWYKRAADQGHAGAQYNLGVRYAQGQGVPKDYIIAHMWGSISAANGSEDGARLRDILQGVMAPSDISKAKKMAGECLGSDYKNCGY
jgi:TPR repeat protein